MNQEVLLSIDGDERQEIERRFGVKFRDAAGKLPDEKLYATEHRLRQSPDRKKSRTELARAMAIKAEIRRRHDDEKGGA